MIYTEPELRMLTTQSVERARALPIGDSMRRYHLDEARRYYVMANNLRSKGRLF